MLLNYIALPKIPYLAKKKTIHHFREYNKNGKQEKIISMIQEPNKSIRIISISPIEMRKITGEEGIP